MCERKRKRIIEVIFTKEGNIMEKLLLIEEELIPNFKRMLYLLQNEASDHIYLKQHDQIYIALEKEQEKLNLKDYSDFDLEEFLKQNPSNDFTELYYNPEFSPLTRLTYQVEKEKLCRLKKKSEKRRLTDIEKSDYYKIIYHFRTVERYLYCHEAKDDVKFYSSFYLQVFYSLWYHTPGLEVPTDVKFTLPYWVTGKNVSLEEYEMMEQIFLEKFFEFFLPEIDEIPVPSFQFDYNLLFFETFLNLGLEHWEKKDLRKVIDISVEKENKQALLQLLRKTK